MKMNKKPEEIQSVYNRFEEKILGQISLLSTEDFENSFTIIQRRATYIEKPEGLLEDDLENFKENAFIVRGMNLDQLIEKVYLNLSVLEGMISFSFFQPSSCLYILPYDEEQFIIFMQSNMPLDYQQKLFEYCYETTFFKKFPEKQCQYNYQPES